MKKRARENRFTRLPSLLLALALLVPAATQALAAAPEEPAIVADGGIVIDYDTGTVLYEKDADTMRVPASMTKVMTAYIIFEELEAGNLSLDTMVTVSAENARKSRDGTNYAASVPLTAGKAYSVDTFLKLILLPSAGASCVVMAERIAGSEEAFVERMNATAQRLGMTAAYENCHGAQPHYITARSQAILVREFIRRFPQILSYTSQTEMEFEGRIRKNTNHLLAGQSYEYPGADGFKTGTITAAGYCLCATAVRDGRRIITVIMHSDNDNTRHTDTIALLDYGFAVVGEKAPFTDMAGHWAAGAAGRLKSLGAELHASGTLFDPDRPVTRAEFTAMLYTALEKREALPEPAGETAAFADMAGHWAEAYVNAAAGRGLTSGVGSESFAPDATITRQEIMTIMDRALTLPDENGLGFSDDGEIALWALTAAARTTAAGLFRGNEAGRLMPTATATRAEAAQAVCNMLDTFAEENAE